MSYRDLSQSSDGDRLLREGEKNPDDYPVSHAKKQSLGSRLFPVSAVLNVFLLLIIAAGGTLSTLQNRKPYIPNEIYSPAQSAVEYKEVHFKGGLHGDFTEYQGSSEEVNARWEDLYNEIGMSQIPADMADRLPNPTTPVAWDNTQYITQLDVFHQLHCLNLLRKLVYPSQFPQDLTSGSKEAQDTIYHLEHCYDNLRQSLMCSSDISTIYFEWSPKNKKMMGNLQTTHTCKDFDKIREWAVHHQLQEEFDMYKHVEGAPVRKAG